MMLKTVNKDVDFIIWCRMNRWAYNNSLLTDHIRRKTRLDTLREMRLQSEGAIYEHIHMGEE